MEKILQYVNNVAKNFGAAVFEKILKNVNFGLNVVYVNCTFFRYFGHCVLPLLLLQIPTKL